MPLFDFQPILEAATCSSPKLLHQLSHFRCSAASFFPPGSTPLPGRPRPYKSPNSYSWCCRKCRGAWSTSTARSRRYGARATTSGHRINLLLWCRSSVFREMKKYQKDFSSWCGECLREKKERQRMSIRATKRELLKREGESTA